jgi:hypothetical protein
MEDKITMIGLSEEEIKIFLELRRINMKCGSIHLNFDENGICKSVDEYRHFNIEKSLSTASFKNT